MHLINALGCELLGMLKSVSLSDYGSWASIIGIFITLFTFIILFGIKKKFLFRFQVDEHNGKLVAMASEMSMLLQSYESNRQDIEELLALVDVDLRAMQRGAGGDLLADIKKCRALISKYRSGLWFRVEATEISARKIKTSISVISAELLHEKKSYIVGK